MEYLSIGGWVSAVGLAVTLAIFGIRNGGLKADAQEADQARKKAESDLKKTSGDFDEYRARAEQIEEELSAELEQYENAEIAAIKAEPDQAVRVKRRRRLVGSVLSKAFNPTGDDSEPGMPKETSP